MPVFFMKPDSEGVISEQCIVWDAKRQKTTRDGKYTRFKRAGKNAWRVAQSVKDAQSNKFSETLVPSGMKCSASLLQLDDSPEDAALAEVVVPAVLDEQGILVDGSTDMAESAANDEDLGDGNLESCGKGVERLSELGKGSSIASSGKDPTFPASMESIASKDGKCGDTAAKKQENCAKYNHWMSLTEIKRQAATGIRVIRVGSSSGDTMKCPSTPKGTTCKVSAETKGKYDVGQHDGYVCISTVPYGKTWTEDLTIVCSDPNATPSPTPSPTPAPAKIFEVGPDDDGINCLKVGTDVTCKVSEGTQGKYSVGKPSPDGWVCVSTDPYSDAGWKEDLKLSCS